MRKGKETQRRVAWGGREGRWGGVWAGLLLAAWRLIRKRVRRKHEANPPEGPVGSEGGTFVCSAQTDVTGTIGGDLGTRW